MTRFTRREFLRKSVGAAALLGLGGRVPAVLRGLRVRAAELPEVAVSKGTHEDTSEAILKTALDGLGGLERFIQPGQSVGIKVNATWAYPPHTASSTDPEVLKALVRMLQAAGAARIVVMDHCSIDPGAAECLRVNGIGQAVDELGVEKVFTSRTESPRSYYTPVDFPQGKSFKKLRVLKAVTEVDVRINLAVAKTHNVTKVSLTMKNMMGLMEAPGLLHADLDQGIADINTPSAIRPHLHILEAVRVRLPKGSYRVCAGPETDETDPDIVRRADQIIAGVDPALIDTYALTEFYGQLPEEVNFLVRAAEGGIGRIDLKNAIEEGRLRVFTTGQSFEQAPVAIASAVTGGETAQETTQLSSGAFRGSTPTPLPLATPANASAVVDASRREGESTAGGVVDVRRYLSGALIPAAAILAGLGLAILRRMERKEGGNEPGARQ
jgi:uncharacterized protein (DUF362 family)